jgi:hypothetical protein
VRELLTQRWLEHYQQQGHGPQAQAATLDQVVENALAATPDDVRQQADDMLHSKDLWKSVLADVHAQGVAGEEALCGMLYLVGTSRLLPGPLAARVHGPSSSGKSYTIERVARLFPPEAMVAATAMSAAALYYLPPDSLRHRWIILGERHRGQDADVAEATRALREMLSAGRLSRVVAVGAGANTESRLVEQEGPIAFVESTTLSEAQIFPEDRNRCVALHTNEGVEQTRVIMDRLAEDAAGHATDPRPARRRHHALQRMLHRRDVAIPFAKQVRQDFPSTGAHVEARRGLGHIFNVIRAVTLLHQYQRGANSEGDLVAVEADYDLAKSLLASAAGRLLGVKLSESASVYLTQLRHHFKPGEEFSSSKAIDAIDKDKTKRGTVNSWLEELHGAGWVRLVFRGVGNKPTIWSLCDAV